MDAELKNLRIDRNQRRSEGSTWAKVWIICGVALILLLGAWRMFSGSFTSAAQVDIQKVTATSTGSPGDVVLNATGYIVAAHKIQLAAKVVGKVKWIGVDKGDHV